MRDLSEMFASKKKKKKKGENAISTDSLIPAMVSRG